MNSMIFFLILLLITIGVIFIVRRVQYNTLEKEVLSALQFPKWDVVSWLDDNVQVKSRQALDKYDLIKYFKEDERRFAKIENIVIYKRNIVIKLQDFLTNNGFQTRPMYNKIKKIIKDIIYTAEACRIGVDYYSSAGNHLGHIELFVNQTIINKFKSDPSLLMNKTEYNKYVKEQQKEALNQKIHLYYEKVNATIDYANQNRESIIVKEKQERIDDLISQLFENTVNKISKIKNIDSEDWNIIGNLITHIQSDIEKIVKDNQMILDYYESSDFQKIKDTCESLMSSQREFNEYINEKVQSISKLFGTRVTRDETVTNDENNYIRPYKKTISPFMAEVSSTVFASAENNPLTYVVKYFYPNKSLYPEQIQKLQILIEELETLKEAKQIIENYKQEYKQYVENVPSYVMENDEAGFYSRLGFANIDENVLSVAYRFSYTSNGGMAQRSFTVPMTEETIIELISMLESKLTANAFAKEQRALMTKKLRTMIKERDNYTCCTCGNSVALEPNLLLEIDHIIPIAKGGITKEDNLQTLCWKCNRSKRDKILI